MKRNPLSVLKRCCAAVIVLFFLPCSATATKIPVDETLEQLLISSYTDGSPVNIADYQLDEDALSDVFDSLYRAGKLPWYTANHFSYIQTENQDHISFFSPEVLDASVYNRVLYEQAVAEVLDATIFEGMTPVQMALSVHDYLIAHCAYDETLERNTGYDLLVNGSTVCAGYAFAYMDLMNRLGIPCLYVSSEEMEHAWNLINIDGSWYHVNLTWDDPTPNTDGTVLHTYFLLTDEEMLSEGEDGHYGWETDFTCTDTRFADAFWKDSQNQICYTNSTTCYLRTDEDYTGSILVRNEYTGTQYALHTNRQQYVNIGHGRFAYSHSGMSLWNDRLYFSDMNTVYSMATDGSDLKTEYCYDAAGNNRFIYSSYVENDTLYLSLGNHDFDCISETVSLTPSGYHVHSYEAVPTPPTCLDAGFTTYACDCGLSFDAEHVTAAGHNYHSETTQSPTPFTEGQCRYTCSACGDTYTEALPTITFLQWIIDLITSLFS